MRIKIGESHLFFDVEGAKEVVEAGGLRKKPTLVLLHGAPGLVDHTSFKPDLSALSDVAQIVYLDLRGAGRSDETLDGDYSLERWADDLVAFCAALQIERPIVHGMSGGGFVALAYAIRHPEHAEAIILDSTQAKLTPERCVATFRRLGGDESAEAARKLLTEPLDGEVLAAYERLCMPLYNRTPRQPSPPPVVRPKLAMAFHDRDGIWDRMDLTGSLHSIRRPTLVLAGEDDPITPIEDSEDIVAGIDSKLVQFERFPDCGHGVWRDNPKRGLSVLSNFLRTQGMEE